jgi:hypothetical protein
MFSPPSFAADFGPPGLTAAIAFDFSFRQA